MTSEEMTPDQRDAYESARTLIAAVAASGWKDLKLTPYKNRSGYLGDAQVDYYLLRHLTKIPPDIAVLSGLRSLDLRGTKVVDIAPLAKLTTLRSLNLSSTLVADIAPLAGLSALQGLDLTNTEVADIAPLAALSRLKYVDFWDSPAASQEPELTRIAAIDNDDVRSVHLKAWLRERYPDGWPPPAPQVPGQSRGGVRFVAHDDYLDPLTDGDIGPLAGAMRTSVVEALHTISKPLPGSNEVPEPREMAGELLGLLEEDLDSINAKAWRLWILSQRYARLAERDDAAKQDASGMARVMSPELRQALDDVVDILPVFARQFPACRDLDGEREDWARAPEAEPAVTIVLDDARMHEVIREEVADALEAYAPPPPGETGTQTDKAARASVFTTRNLVYAGLGVVATVSIGELTLGVLDGTGARAALSQRVANWMGSKPKPIEDLLQGAPPDVVTSVRAHLQRLEKLPAPWKSPTPPPKP